MTPPHTPPAIRWRGHRRVLARPTRRVAALSTPGVDAGVGHWVLGGWGVDALQGHQTCQHRDLDLANDADRWGLALDSMTSLGYVVETDWWPVRVELAGPQGWVDLGPDSVRHLGHRRRLRQHPG
jgi:hypothetical protein